VRELSSRVHRRGAADCQRKSDRALRAPPAPRSGCVGKEHQIETTFDTNELKSFIDDVEEDGVIDATELETKAVELELDDDELALLRAELESRGVEITAAAVDAEELDVDPDRADTAEPEAELRLEADLTGVTDSVTLFMSELGKHDLLTAAEEVALAKRVERGDSAAKERMINSNLRLVVHIAKRYRGRGVPFGDLIQEGVIGLNRAVEKFDWRRASSFSPKRPCGSARPVSARSPTARARFACPPTCTSGARSSHASAASSRSSTGVSPRRRSSRS
jgi:hypothetical protein